MIKIKKKIREEKPATEHSQCPIARTVSVLVLKTVQTFLGINFTQWFWSKTQTHPKNNN